MIWGSLQNVKICQMGKQTPAEVFQSYREWGKERSKDRKIKLSLIKCHWSNYYHYAVFSDISRHVVICHWYDTNQSFPICTVFHMHWWLHICWIFQPKVMGINHHLRSYFHYSTAVGWARSLSNEHGPLCLNSCPTDVSLTNTDKQVIRFHQAYCFTVDFTWRKTATSLF